MPFKCQRLCSIPLIQRKSKVNYAKAKKIYESLPKCEVVSRDLPLAEFIRLMDERGEICQCA